jgi:ankyrin repeat protein
MSIQIKSNIIGLQQINSSLNSDQRAISEKTWVKTVSNLHKLLSELEIHVKAGFTPLTENLKPDAIEVLHNLNQTLDAYNQKVQAIKNKILHVQAAVAIAPVNDKKEIPSIEIKPIAFFCDLDSPDHNTAIWSMIKEAVTQSLPFVTTRSLLRGTGHIDLYHTSTVQLFMDNEQFLLKEQSHWDIFKKGEMLVFMPRSYLPEMNSQEKLAAFDFTIDGSLQPISMQEALQGPQENATIDAFIDLFAAEPKANKLFHLAGHGFTDRVGGLKPPSYSKFLNFLNHQRCKGLSITSCFSGGQSALLNIPERESDMANFFAQDNPHSFHTLMRSMGDFPTESGQEAEKDLKGFLQEFAAFVSSPEGQTFAQLRRRIEKLEEGKKKKTLRNLMQFYPAHGAGSPAAPRSLAEGARGFPLTYTLSKRAEIGSAKPFSKSENSQEIAVKDAELLEVYPLVTRAPIKFVNKNPILLSKSPGKGHHFIKSIELAGNGNQGNPGYGFLKSIINFYKEYDFGTDTRYDQSHVDKAFFVATIEDPSHICAEGLALSLSSSGSFAILSLGDKYGVIRGKDLKFEEIDPLTYAILSYEIVAATRGDPKAIRALSAGQESEALFQEVIQEANFFPAPFFSLFTLKENSVECVPNFIELMKERSSLNERINVILFLLKQGHANLALELANAAPIHDYKIQDFQGNSLLDLAIQADALEFVEYMLKDQNLDPNEVNSADITPLHLTVRHLKQAYHQQAKDAMDLANIVKKREMMLDLLLAHPKINVNAKNSKGWPPITEALPNSAIVNKLIGKGAAISPCIGLFVGMQDHESVDLLLKLKVDPSSQMAVYNALRLNDLSLVKKLLQAGAKFDVRTLNEAIFKASPAIVQLMINHENCPLLGDNFSEITPMLAALITGNNEKIHLLKAKKAPLPADYSWLLSEKALTGIFERYVSKDDRAGLEELLQLKPNFNLICRMIKYLLDKNQIALLKDLIMQNQIDINALGYCSSEDIYRNTTLLQVLLKRTKNQELIEICFDKVTDFNKVDFFDALIKQGRLDWVQSAVESTDLTTESGLQIFKWLVEQGADLNAAGKDKLTPFCHAIANGCFELVAYCLNKGAKIVLEDSNLVAPLAFAASVQKNNSTKIFKHLFKQVLSNFC